MNDTEQIIIKIKKKAQDNVNQKLEAEKQKIENKIMNELKLVEKCLEYIQNKMIYKKIEDKYNWNVKQYILATEEMFFEDYIKENGRNWNQGIFFDENSRLPHEPLFKVNGECYYDVRYIIRNYEETFRSFSDKLFKLQQEAELLTKAAKDLKQQESHIKNLLQQYEQIEIKE